jgi:hypothetical protein
MASVTAAWRPGRPDLIVELAQAVEPGADDEAHLGLAFLKDPVGLGGGLALPRRGSGRRDPSRWVRACPLSSSAAHDCPARSLRLVVALPERSPSNRCPTPSAPTLEMTLSWHAGRLSA